MHITKKLLKCPAVVKSCKNFLLRAVAGPPSCKKKIRDNVVHRPTTTKTEQAREGLYPAAGDDNPAGTITYWPL
jgi:hypothetical protein